jgi:hypothetical protein
MTKSCFITTECLSGTTEHLSGAAKPYFVVMEPCLVTTKYLFSTIAPTIMKFCNGDRR